MDVIDFFNHPVKKQNIEYYVHLVRIAKADDIITKNELELLYNIGLRLGFTEIEIDNLISATGKSDYIPPYELYERFEQVYEIVKMTMADGVINKNEMRLATSFALKSGFKENEIGNILVLLISGIRQGKDAEDIFETYKKERKVLTIKKA